MEIVKFTPTPTVNGLCEPAEVYQPDGVVTLCFKEFAVQCGGCGRDFVRFRIIPPNRLMPLTCPYCRAKNLPQFMVGP